MRLFAYRGGLLRELIIAFAMLALAVWASAALLARFFLGNLHWGPIPILPMVFSPLEAFAFPILATVVGFALAQGSAGNRNSVNYGLGRIYDQLASKAIERFESQVPPEVTAFIERVADYLERNQRAQTWSAEARQSIVQVASELRHLARQLQPAEPRTSEQYAQLARSISSLVYTRRLRVELDRKRDDQPLSPGEECVLRLRFEPEQGTAGLPAYFGGRCDLDLTLFLFGQGVVLGETALALKLPLRGESTEAATTLQLLPADSHQLRIVVTTTTELEVLQTYLTPLDVAAGSSALA